MNLDKQNYNGIKNICIYIFWFREIIILSYMMLGEEYIQ